MTDKIRIICNSETIYAGTADNIVWRMWSGSFADDKSVEAFMRGVAKRVGVDGVDGSDANAFLDKMVAVGLFLEIPNGATNWEAFVKRAVDAYPGQAVQR